MPAMIRPARETDAFAVSGLLSELGYRVSPALVSLRIEELADASSNAVFVAEIDGVVIGCGQVFEYSSLVSGRSAKIGCLVVTGRCRSKGIGALLVEAMEVWSLERGLDELQVGTRMERERAHAFYERLGFNLVKGHRIYAKPLVGTGSGAH